MEEALKARQEQEKIDEAIRLREKFEKTKTVEDQYKEESQNQYNKQLMRTSKMIDDNVLLSLVKDKQFLKMQQTYKGKPFITKKTEMASSKSPSIVDNLKSRGTDVSTREKELGDFETKF